MQWTGWGQDCVFVFMDKLYKTINVNQINQTKCM